MQGTDDTVVELEGVTKKIRGKTIIDNLSFRVRRGEVYGFLGPNGAGKTTTIRMIVGLMSMTSGRIRIEGHDIRTDRAKAMTHVGAVVENPELYKFMSGRKNLLHFARLSGKSISEERIEEIVRLVELENAIDKKVKNYSLGMRQRLGIAQALLHDPSILILDEPTNGLDPAGIRQLRDYLRRLAREEKISILVSSHLLSEIELMCDRVVIIQNGKFVGERELNLSVDAAEARPATIYLEVDRAEEALQAVAAADWPAARDESRSGITVNVMRNEIPKVVEKLVHAGIAIYEVRTSAPTLEDTFLTMTKGGRIE
ncbi:ABC transporter ATP-binding protein [Paenibacillus melissococcoides]|uniref:ABC transporter ATP-binding protein n=1 Tax=Paenibacillus melissococcoides TaxID=2912268 RepID=A0ABM9G5W9_9BACL|nr:MULTISPECIES: ABC transporter ATP-binding protein [Paenibacillus]MEB9895691.1 ABC transporter ATP-binding protein [Bacillus cereus]CAH8247065.1 ABC transporter ATP-binding protein [Paenibacillus melissococcoides]CAH8716633.1 ABC transporter ATP-binding protein [Paenibacillus melissococcoides]CAH8717597.1 ABC transporter ATP-binding protein [Paenibacillus melissococcoides]GIO81054.1 ABC transporter ATP-binding protein [Paenibacillus dendritiformis]